MTKTKRSKKEDAPEKATKDKKPPVPVARQPVAKVRPSWMGRRPGMQQGMQGPVGAGAAGARIVPRGAVGMQHPQARMPQQGTVANQESATVSSFGGGGKRGFLFYRHVRRELAAGLVRERGYDWQAAREAANDLSEVDIDKMATKARIGKLGDGSFIQWLIDHGPQIMQFITMLISLFAMFGTKNAELKKMRSAWDDEDDEDQEDETAEDEQEAAEEEAGSDVRDG